MVRQPSYIEGLNAIWNEVSLQQWKDYTSFKYVDSFAAYLSDDFVEAQFDFQGRTLGGLEEMRPRWKRGVDTVDGALGEVVGRLYVEQHFQEEAKARMDVLVENLREAFRVGINELEWMTDVTKEQAQDKLAKFTTKIGYPEEWKDYSALTVDPADLFGNVSRSRMVEHNRELEKLGSPINRGEWFMTPHTVNAYYNPPMNEIVFPAAILQPPFLMFRQMMRLTTAASALSSDMNSAMVLTTRGANLMATATYVTGGQRKMRPLFQDAPETLSASTTSLKYCPASFSTESSHLVKTSATCPDLPLLTRHTACRLTVRKRLL